MGAQVHLDGAGAQKGGGGGAGVLAPPQSGLDAGYQLAGAEGLGDVVLGAQGEADHLVGLFVLRRQEDDRDVAQLANAHAQLEAVDAGHHDVHNGQVEGRACQLFQSRLAAIAGQGVHALGHQQVDHQVGDGLFVVYHQDVRSFFHGPMVHD